MRPSLSLILPALAVAACDQLSSNSCSGFKGGTFDNERTYAVSDAELDAALDDDGELSESACHELCRAHHWYEEVIVEIHSCTLEDASEATVPLSTGDTGALPAGAITCAWTESAVCEGRAHAALTTHAQGAGPTHLAAWLARAAHAEAASVKAFLSLSRELEAHGAPSHLVAAARQAAAEEVQHARLVGDLAASRGGRPTKPRMGPTPVRSLRELAVENAVEGCVRETWSAMVAHWQAIHAADPELRRSMERIAVDEARHGDLAHAIYDWAMTRLDKDDQKAVRIARDRAVLQLLEGLDAPTEPALLEAAGLPRPRQARHLARQLAAQLWTDLAEG